MHNKLFNFSPWHRKCIFPVCKALQGQKQALLPAIFPKKELYLYTMCNTNSPAEGGG